MNGVKKVVLLIIAVFVLGFIGYYAHFFLIDDFGFRPLDCERVFHANIEEYTRIMKFIYADFEKCECKVHRYSITNDPMIYEERYNGCADYWKTILANNKEYESFLRVKETYRVRKNGFESIFVYENYVVFITEMQNIAALIYSVDDTKPNFVTSPYDNYRRITVKKIADNWYYSHRRQD